MLNVNISVQESERLEMVNSDLKAQIEELRMERQQLMVMLNLHRPTCIVRTDSVKTPESEANPLLEELSAGTKWNQEKLGRGVPDAQTSTNVAVIWNNIDDTFVCKHLSSKLETLGDSAQRPAVVGLPQYRYTSWLCPLEDWKYPCSSPH